MSGFRMLFCYTNYGFGMQIMGQAETRMAEEKQRQERE